jgi:ankyrin repeat protein
LALGKEGFENTDSRELELLCFRAGERNHSEAVYRLLDMGADPDLIRNTKKTPLHLAAEGGRYAAVLCLLNKRANAGLEGNEGMTPLYLVVTNGHSHVCWLLLEKGSPNVGVMDEGLSLGREGNWPAVVIFEKMMD